LARTQVLGVLGHSTHDIERLREPIIEILVVWAQYDLNFSISLFV